MLSLDTHNTQSPNNDEQLEKLIAEFTQQNSNNDNNMRNYNLGIFLKQFTKENLRLVCEKIPSSLFTTVQDFPHILCELTPEQIRTVFEVEAWKNQLKVVVTNANNFFAVMMLIIDETSDIVFDILKSKVIDLANNANDFNTIIISLDCSKRIEVYEIYKDRLANLITTVNDLELIFKFLLPPQRENAIEIYFSQKPPTQIIKSCADFILISPHLSPQQKKMVLNCSENLILSTIKNSIELDELLLCLDSKEREIFINKLISNNLVQVLIQSYYDIIKILHHLSPEQLRAVYYRVESKIISSYLVADINHVLKTVNNLVIIELFLFSRKKALSNYINSANDFTSIFSNIRDKNKRNLIFQKLKDILIEKNIIKNPKDFHNIFQILDIKEKQDFFPEIQEQLLEDEFIQSIEDVTDLYYIFFNITADNFRTLTQKDAFKKRILDIIKGYEEFELFINTLFSEISYLTYNKCLNEITELIIQTCHTSLTNNISNLGNISINFVSDKQIDTSVIHTYLNLFKDKLNDLIQTTSDFQTIAQRIALEYLEESWHIELPALLLNKNDFQKFSTSSIAINLKSYYDQEIGKITLTPDSTSDSIKRLVTAVGYNYGLFCTTTNFFQNGFLFFSHGTSGKNRVVSFLQKIAIISDANELHLFIYNYLKNPDNGNTKPNSFRTKLLNALVTAYGLNNNSNNPSFDELLLGYQNKIESMAKYESSTNALPLTK
ncbi:MAG: hypothetical protein KIT27_01955 [Legionellales bacterium]|nr:hypothetical protein [Legionellales bacterium]